MFENLFGKGKTWTRSLTAWGLIVFFGVTAALDQACAGGAITEEMCARLSGWSESIGAILTVLGIRKAATAPNSA